MIDKKEIIEELEKLKDSLVIVEGKKDKKALEKFGLKNILMLEGNAIFEVIEKVDSEVAILTDLDSKGKELYKRLQSKLTKRGVKINNKLRHLLLRSDLKVIEGIDTFLKSKGL
ncbi:MAG: toprim domain-containing protein [Nanoarchaeota archaeon]|nr:toprim domain-containing protein [Nanoarchaeota archaeon]MBU4351934.1 toprim domain-containing protein [Nanoarchaeota archaeon]